jgi:MFS family permease
MDGAAPIATRGAVVRVVAVLGLTYVLSHYLRASSAVIAPELIRDLALTPEQLSLMVLAFFLGGGLAQIPVGMAIDRFGGRRTLYGLMLLAAAGSLLFSAADGAVGLTAARFLMGVGCAAGAMGAVAVFARWVAPDRLAGVSGILFAAGTTGGLLATTPLAFAAETVGWRATFVAMAALALVITVVGYAVVRDAPPGAAVVRREPETARQVWQGFLAAARMRVMHRIMLVSLVNYPAVATVLTLWGAPYLHDVHGLGAVAIGNVLLAMNVGLIAGYVVFGQLDRPLDTRKWLVIAGLVGLVAPMATLAAVPAPPVPVVVGLLVLYGFASAFGALLVAHVRAVVPDRLFGRAATLNNMMLFMGSVVLQGLTGFVAGRFEAVTGALPIAAYQAVFACLALTAVLAIVVYLPVADPKPSLDRRR